VWPCRVAGGFMGSRVASGGHGWLWGVAGGLRRLRVVLGSAGGLRGSLVSSLSRKWIPGAAAGLDRLLVASGGCGWPRVVAGGCR
jgi:hypothetical protein